MNTPAHLIFGAAAFGRPRHAGITAAALMGALMPDLSLYLMVAWARFVSEVPAREIFGELYFSDAWMSVFAIDNSVPLWSALLGLAIWRRWPLLVAFAGAGLLHLAFDLPLHGGDARPMFWPFTDWRFDSPFSYWDNSHHASLVGPLEVGLSVMLTALMVWRYQSHAARAGLVLLLAAELGSSGIWRFVF